MRALAAIAAAALAVAFSIAGAAGATAAIEQSQHSYATTLTPTGPQATAGAYTGTLRLTTWSSGVVAGYYIPDYMPTFIPVTGSVSNGKVWLTIGERGDLVVNAHIRKDGTIVGTAQELNVRSEVSLPATYDFVAKLEASKSAGY